MNMNMLMHQKSQRYREWWSPFQPIRSLKVTPTRWRVGVTFPARLMSRKLEAWTLAEEKALKEVGVALPSEMW